MKKNNKVYKEYNKQLKTLKKEIKKYLPTENKERIMDDIETCVDMIIGEHQEAFYRKGIVKGFELFMKIL